MLFLDRLYLKRTSLHQLLCPTAHHAIVALEELELVEELGLHDIDTIISIHELNDRAIVIPHSHIVANHKRLKLLDQAALQIAGPGRLNCRVDQTFSSRHTVEEKVLRPKPRDKSVRDVAGCAWIRIKRHETGQCLTVLHARYPTSFKFLLAKQGANLSLIDDAAFGTGLYHGRDHVLRELFD